VPLPDSCPEKEQPLRQPYIFVAALDETLFHIVCVELATLRTAATVARKIRASIRPYSTAVAALVDRISL
jgi:hypothetical protein